jgi:hypothetical protein
MRNVRLIVCAFVVVVCSLIGGQVAFAGGFAPTPFVSYSYTATCYNADDTTLSFSGMSGQIDLPSGNGTIYHVPSQKVVVTRSGGGSVTLSIPGTYEITDNGTYVFKGRNLIVDAVCGASIQGVKLLIGTFSCVGNSLVGTKEPVDVCAMVE